MEEQNKELQPTIPTQNVFDANQLKPQPVSPPTEPLIDKSKIIAKHRTGFPVGIIFGTIVILVLVLLIAVVLKNFSLKGNTNGEINLVWWSVQEDVDAVSPLITEYEQQHPNVKIQFVSESKQDYAARLANALSGNKAPDIFEYHNSWVPMFQNNLGFTKDDFSKILYPVATNDLKTKNGYVGIPLEYDGIALFLNTDIMNAYGKNPPKTWDDFRTLAQNLTVLDKNGVIQQAGTALGVTSNIDYWQDILGLLLLQNGADPVNPTTLSGQSALTFYTNFSKTDHVWDSTLPQSTLDFTTGHVAMYFGLYSDVFNIQKQNPNLHFEVVPLPQLPTNESTIPSVSYANYWVNGVSKTSPNAAAAWDFLKFMTTQESLHKLYANEKKIRGYGNLYPRSDMQQELLSDTFGGPFIYQANFAKSWYLDGNTFDGATGINSLVSKPYSDAIDSLDGNSGSDLALKNIQASLAQILSSYGLVAVPVASPQ